MVGIPEQVPERFLKMSVPELVAKTRREALEEAARAIEETNRKWPIHHGTDFCAAVIRALIDEAR